MSQNTINRSCRMCGKPFTVTEAHLKGQQKAKGENACTFCSKTCARLFDGQQRGVWQERTCKQCGNSFKWRASASKVQSGRGLYCSRDCEWASMGAGIISYCAKCGKEMRNHPSAVRKYCSRECYGRAPGRMKKICERCGKPYECDRCDAAKSKYCSHPCLWEANAERRRKHGDAKRARLVSKPWARRRQECIDRDGGACVLCGTTDNLTAHHIIPWIISEDDGLDNLMTLCRSCHMQVEPMGKHSQWRDLIWLL